MKTLDPKSADTTALAYMGDAVYEVYIRKYVVNAGIVHAHEMNREAVSFVRAEAQARVAKQFLAEDFLTEEERALLKRARNRTNTSHARGSGYYEYKLATGLEALIGWLYLKGDRERTEAVCAEAMRIIREARGGAGKEQHE